MKTILQKSRMQLILILLVSLVVCLGCDNETEEKIKSAVWKVDQVELGLFRKLDPKYCESGKPCDEFYPIDHEEIKKFSCMHEEHFTYWVRYCQRRCK